MDNKKVIKTTKQIYPQIYAYTLPNRQQNIGWQKIGYTERSDVDQRIREQTHTAAFSEEYHKLWSTSSIYEPVEKAEFFNDHDFHKYLVKNGIRKDEGLGKEWFYFNGTPEKSKEMFEAFRRHQFVFNQKSKIDYTLRFEQNIAVEQTLEYANNNQTTDFEKPNNKAQFLWNAKPRFGKTLTTYDFAKRFGAKNVLIVTNRPSIANSWYDDFEKFIDGYYFISTTDSLKEHPTLTHEEYDQTTESNKKQFTFLSLQDLKGGKVFGGSYDKLQWVADLSWDLLVIDEAHEAVDTGKTDTAFNNIKRRFTLHLSGTPFKALASGKFSDKQIFNWTYIDEQMAKEDELKQGESGAHTDMPDMRLFTYKISDMLAQEINEGMQIDDKDTSYAFNLNEFFATHNGKFIHEADVITFLDRLSKNEKYPFSTPELREELKHTFWMVGNRVSSAKAMKQLLHKHPVFGNGDYEIIVAAGDGLPLSDDDEIEEETKDFNRNEKALDRVRKAIKSHDKTITLSVGQLTTGVTIKEWSAVLMLSDIKAEPLYMQTIFRAQNPYQFKKDGKIFRKKSAYVFDFAPNRVLEVYDSFANSLVHDSATGNTTEEARRDNIAKLLNYFPVLSEDENGQMIELDATQVLTFPKAIIAREVVEHRFITNLLFRNVSNVFNLPSEVRTTINKLSSTTDQGRVSKQKEDVPDDIDRRIRTTKRISQNRHVIFADPVYGKIKEITTKEAENLTSSEDYSQRVLDNIQNQVAEPIYSKFKDIYNPTKTELAKIKEAHTEKIRMVVDEFVTSPQKPADFKQMNQQITDIIEQDMPRDLVDEREEKEFEKEEKSDLDIIKSKLKSFSRAIPSLVMASHDPKILTIDNIENVVSDADFEEIFTETLNQGANEPFTKEDFRLLRDGHNHSLDLRPQGFDGFFEKYVFNASIQEFEKKRQELANYLTNAQKEDIFTYIPPQKTNQIFTPRKVVNQMLNILEKNNPGIFENPDLTFADLYVKSGLYLAEIAKRLNHGLAKQIPDQQARLKHIFEHQLYGFTPTQIIHDIAENYVYGDLAGISHNNLKFKDLTPDFKEGRIGNMKFDVVIGNPPYQEETKDTSDKPIYNYFMSEAYKIADKVCFITPARFLFNAGKTPKRWNAQMLNDEHLKVAYYEQTSDNIFPHTDIKGGVAITYRDSNQHFGKIGTFTHYEELNSTLQKVINFEGFRSIDEIYFGQEKFNLAVLYSKNQDARNIIGSDGREKRLTSAIFNQLSSIFSENSKNPNDLKILGVINNKRKWRYINSEYIEDHPNLHKFKVILPGSNGSGAIGEVLSTPLIGEPLIGHTQTFISFGAFDTREEAEALLKYMKTKFARTMLGTLKITQSNKKDTWRNVPIQDFTAQSDIDWSKSVAEIDQQLYKKYSLNTKEIAFIEEKVRAME